jgi:hypothetical protein
MYVFGIINNNNKNNIIYLIYVIKTYYNFAILVFIHHFCINFSRVFCIPKAEFFTKYSDTREAKMKSQTLSSEVFII